MSKRILYIGNKLAVHGKSPTTIDTLGLQFEEMGFIVSYASSEVNKVKRLFDMVYSTYRLRKKVDYVCIDTYSKQGFYFTFIISLLCRSLKLKYIPFLHGGRLPERLDNNPRVSAYIFNNSFKNVAPSNYLHTVFLKNNYPSTLIPNSIPLKDYSFKARDETKCRLLFVRHLAEIYNPLMAIRVVEMLKTTFPDVCLNIVGEDKDGSKDKCIALIDELGLQSNVIFSGRLSKSEWHKLSLDYDIFINTTNFDNMPVSVIEAMALGLPVVSTNVGGLPFLIDDKNDGFLVDRNDHTAMSECIVGLVKDHEKALATAEKARKKVESFNWDVVKKQWISVFSR